MVTVKQEALKVLENAVREVRLGKELCTSLNRAACDLRTCMGFSINIANEHLAGAIKSDGSNCSGLNKDERERLADLLCKFAIEREESLKSLGTILNNAIESIEGENK